MRCTLLLYIAEKPIILATVRNKSGRKMQQQNMFSNDTRQFEGDG